MVEAFDVFFYDGTTRPGEEEAKTKAKHRKSDSREIRIYDLQNGINCEEKKVFTGSAIGATSSVKPKLRDAIGLTVIAN